jgi:hypothetical protein
MNRPPESPTQPKAVIAPRGWIRCILTRKVGNQLLVLGFRTVKASQQMFYVKVQGEWLAFLIDPSLSFMVAPVKRLLGLQTVSMPFLMYDIDWANPMMFTDATGVETAQALVREALKMHGELIPSIRLGDIKKREVYFQGMKAQMNKQGTNMTMMMTIILLVVGIAIGVVLGRLI